MKTRNLCLPLLFVFCIGILMPVAVDAESYKPSRAMPRIIGGEKAPSGAWPWMVALVDGPDNYQDQFCGATLIAPQWVVTTAHCATVPPFEVLIGVENLGETGERIAVKNVYVHPSFLSSSSPRVRDLALLELEQAATQTPIPLYEGSDSLEGTSATILGWGTTAPDGSTYPYDLMQAQVPIVTQQTCIDAFSGTPDTYIEDWELCAGLSEGGVDACHGDSGGPLMIYEGDAWKLAGTTSWGIGCAEPGYYGVYTRISSVYDWLMQTMDPIAGDYSGNRKLGLEDSIGILQEVTGLR